MYGSWVRIPAGSQTKPLKNEWFFCIRQGSNEGSGWVRFGEGSGMSLGHAGLNHSQRDHKPKGRDVRALLCSDNRVRYVNFL